MGRPIINPTDMSDDALASYDRMMTHVAVSFEEVSPLAISIWSDVLKELDKRGKVTLIAGSYDDIGNALIHRN